VTGAPGWYPDPGGQPDRYRYWDGASWSAETTGDPHRTAPETMTQAPLASRPHAVRWLILITVLAVVVAAGSLAFRFHNRQSEQPVLFPTPSTSAPSPTRNDRDDSPSGLTSHPGPNTPDANRTPRPTSAAPRAIGCPEGAPDARSPHPSDGRVHGGNLSFPRVDSFVPEAPENRLTFAYDVVQQVRTVSLDPPWIAQLGLGRLLADGYPRTAQHTAELVTECIVASDLYRPYDPHRRDVDSRPITVSGTDGWLITTDLEIGVAGLPFAGDHVAVVVVPDGADWGVFFGAVPIGDRTLTDTLTTTVLGLRVG
jgi:hypothetical protein